MLKTIIHDDELPYFLEKSNFTAKEGNNQQNEVKYLDTRKIDKLDIGYMTMNYFRNNADNKTGTKGKSLQDWVTTLFIKGQSDVYKAPNTAKYNKLNLYYYKNTMGLSRTLKSMKNNADKFNLSQNKMDKFADHIKKKTKELILEYAPKNKRGQPIKDKTVFYTATLSYTHGHKGNAPFGTAIIVCNPENDEILVEHIIINEFELTHTPNKNDDQSKFENGYGTAKYESKTFEDEDEDFFEDDFFGEEDLGEKKESGANSTQNKLEKMNNFYKVNNKSSCVEVKQTSDKDIDEALEYALNDLL